MAGSSIAAVADEEHSSLGADALVKTWHADAAVVTEPTGLDVAVAHKGFQWIAVETRGRAAHGSRPRDGRDAIMRMGRVLSRLEQLEKRLRRRRESRPPRLRLASCLDHRRRRRVEQLSRQSLAAVRASDVARESPRT